MHTYVCNLSDYKVTIKLEYGGHFERHFKFSTLVSFETSKLSFNPRLTKLFFVTRLTTGGCYNSLPRFSEPNPYEIDFGINM